jgi:hypothetical protein
VFSSTGGASQTARPLLARSSVLMSSKRLRLIRSGFRGIALTAAVRDSPLSAESSNRTHCMENISANEGCSAQYGRVSILFALKVAAICQNLKIWLLLRMTHYPVAG